MNEILELQTGQVAFISSLMAGFSLAVAVQIYRSKATGNLAIIIYILFTITSLLFFIALYIDVALSLRLAGFNEVGESLIERVSSIRTIGTSAATVALFLFVASIGVMGWLQSRTAGIVTSIAALASIIILWIARAKIFSTTSIVG